MKAIGAKGAHLAAQDLGGFQGTCMYACGDGVDHRPTDELDSSPAEFAAAILVGVKSPTDGDDVSEFRVSTRAV